MKIYQYKKETNELIREFDNVIYWGYNYVEFDNGGRCKIYCDDTEYFTDKKLEVEDGNN